MSEMLAWTAGFLEGEGSFYLNRGNPVVKAKQVQQEPLARLQAAHGGSMNRYQRTDTDGYLRQPIHEWVLTGRRALLLMERLRPLMSPRRRLQIDDCLVAAHRQLALIGEEE
jgi:hypothetical protein